MPLEDWYILAIYFLLLLVLIFDIYIGFKYKKDIIIRLGCIFAVKPIIVMMLTLFLYENFEFWFYSNWNLHVDFATAIFFALEFLSTLLIVFIFRDMFSRRFDLPWYFLFLDLLRWALLIVQFLASGKTSDFVADLVLVHLILFAIFVAVVGRIRAKSQNDKEKEPIS